MTDHAHELRRYSRKIGHPAGDVPAVMLAAADEIERLAARLEAAEKSDAESLAMYRKARDERDELRAKIERMERQEPVAWRTFDGEGGYDYRNFAGNEDYQAVWEARNPNHKGWVEPLYALPGAKGEVRETVFEVTGLIKSKSEAKP